MDPYSLDHIILPIPTLVLSKTINQQLEARGFEPLTLGLQSRCSSQLSYAPDYLTSLHREGKENGKSDSATPRGDCLQDFHLLADGLVCA